MSGALRIIALPIPDCEIIIGLLIIAKINRENALSFIENKNAVECLLIERTESGEFRTFMSSGFGAYLLE